MIYVGFGPDAYAVEAIMTISALGGPFFFPVSLAPNLHGACGAGIRPNNFPFVRSAIAMGRKGNPPYHDNFNLENHTHARVTCYGFRGDARSPDVIRKAGGFQPNAASRYPDESWEFSLCLQMQVYNPRSSAFVAFSRSPFTAMHFALKEGRGKPCWVYAAFIEEGFDMLKAKGFPKELRRQQELSPAGGVDWENVVAYRRFGDRLMYVRNGFEQLEPAAWRSIRSGLSSEV